MFKIFNSIINKPKTKKTMEVKISKASALNAFKKADKNGKELLTNLVGDQVNFSEKITDRVKTFKDACEAIGVIPADDVAAYGVPPILKKDVASLQAYPKLIIIARALNEGWEPDFNNSSEYKYYPWFKNSGSGFSYHGYVYSFTFTCVGARLCFKTSELAKYAGAQFESIYNDYLTL